MSLKNWVGYLPGGLDRILPGEERAVACHGVAQEPNVSRFLALVIIDQREFSLVADKLPPSRLTRAARAMAEWGEAKTKIVAPTRLRGGVGEKPLWWRRKLHQHFGRRSREKRGSGIPQAIVEVPEMQTPHDGNAPGGLLTLFANGLNLRCVNDIYAGSMLGSRRHGHRRNSMRQGTVGGMRPSQRPLNLVGGTDMPAIYFAEFPEARTKSVEMPRAHCGDGFHRMQMESIGVRLSRTGRVEFIGGDMCA